jgi:glutathione peroxidase
MNVYDFTVKDRAGKEVSLSEYKGKVLLVVNTATRCGFTPQYEELEAIYEKLSSKGLEILDFPCNQFKEQAPESNDEIHAFCTAKFGTKFPQFAKLEVNGEHADPLYNYLKQQKGFAGFDMAHPIAPALVDILGKDEPDYEKNPSIKWNFTKFLIDRKGNVVARFEPTHDLADVTRQIEALL